MSFVVISKIQAPPSVNIARLPAFLLLIILSLQLCTSACAAETIEELNPVNTPDGAVILIVDGLGSCYVYPEYTPYAIDGSMLKKAESGNLYDIFNQSCRVLDVKAPQTFTEGGHSVIATGYSKADSGITGSTDTTIYDIAHDNSFLTFAIMEKGDSAGMCSKQNVIIHDTTNSITSPQMEISVNDIPVTNNRSISEITAILENKSVVLQSTLSSCPEGSQEIYNAYNTWAIETGTELIKFMKSEYPDQKYILTINAGAVDCAGHYRKNAGYVASIEGIDNATFKLYETCRENNVAFIMTADHGMSFATENSRGGHEAEKYSVMEESQKVPLVISACDVTPGIISGEYGQQDIAPTVLELLNIPADLRVADGSSIPVKEYANLRVDVDEEGTLEIMKNSAFVYKMQICDTACLMGMEKGENYTLIYKPASSDNELKKDITLSSSSVICMNTLSGTSGNDITAQNTRYIIGGILIVIVNLTGLILIAKILKE